MLVFFLGELDDQDGVLGGQADHHDQSDLGEHVQLEPAEPERAEGAEDGDRRAQQDAERPRPALVLGGQGRNTTSSEEPETAGGGAASSGPLPWSGSPAGTQPRARGTGSWDDGPG